MPLLSQKVGEEGTYANWVSGQSGHKLEELGRAPAALARPLRDDRFPGRFDRHSTARCLILKFRYSIPAPSSLPPSLSLFCTLPLPLGGGVSRTDHAEQRRLGTPETGLTRPLRRCRRAAPLRRCRVVEYECRFFTWRRHY